MRSQRLSTSFVTLLILTLSQLCLAQNPTKCTIPGTSEQGIQGEVTNPYTGQPTCLALDRQPALYTGAFGDCLGSSELQVNRFSAAYYQDNLTLSFDLEGRTDVDNAVTIIYISVYAYGENHFQYIWSPCGSSAQSICPTNSSHPFAANLLIPLGQSDIARIPDIAFQIPDFEGQAIMRIFNNNTQTEMACYSAVISNGLTFSSPASIGTIVGLFVLVAMFTSVATAIYGNDIIENRLHYAHSMSVWVVFAVLQHVFLTGALSVNWPSVLPAWWSNFAWAVGMIYSPSMQTSISTFVGNDLGNTTFVGAASTGSSSDGTGGGYSKGQILQQANSAQSHKRALFREPALLKDAYASVEHFWGRDMSLTKRDTVNDTFTWFGGPVTPGLPLPGNYSGFAGTLSLSDIPASNAFMTGFLWLIIIIVIMTAAIVALKWTLELLAGKSWIQPGRFSLFRRHWIRFTGQVALRICYIAFFLMMFLTMFHFSYRGAAGPIAIASLVFILFLVGGIGLAGWACWYRLRYGQFIKSNDKLHVEVVKAFPPINIIAESKRQEKIKWSKSLFSVPWVKIEHSSNDPRQSSVHQDADYIRKFGWLAARYRADEWWFFVFWLAYDFLRAIFLGGAAGHPQTQVFALLAIEFIAFCVLIWMKPFEANRLNALMIYLLGLSKILTTALSSAFDPAFNLGRTITTALGVIIVVIQALLLIAMMILVVIGAVSTYISLMRNREVFYPEHWRPAQRAYMRHLTGEEKAHGTAKMTDGDLGALDKGDRDAKPGFRVDNIRRLPKIGDDRDAEAQYHDPYGSAISLSGNVSPIGVVPPISALHTRRTSRAFSVNSGHGNLPFGARPVRAESWSTHDFQGWHGTDSHRGSMPRFPGAIASAFHSTDSLHGPGDGYRVAPARGRASTLRSINSPAASRGVTPAGVRRGNAPKEYQLQVMKTRPDTTKSRSAALAPRDVSGRGTPSTVDDVKGGTSARENTTASENRQSPAPAKQ